MSLKSVVFLVSNVLGLVFIFLGLFLNRLSLIGVWIMVKKICFLLVLFLLSGCVPFYESSYDKYFAQEKLREMQKKEAQKKEMNILSERKKSQEEYVKMEVEKRGDNGNAILVSKYFEKIPYEGFFIDPDNVESCVNLIEIKSSGVVLNLHDKLNDCYFDDRGVSNLVVIPAIKNGVNVDSFALVSIGVSEYTGSFSEFKSNIFPIYFEAFSPILDVPPKNISGKVPEIGVNLEELDGTVFETLVKDEFESDKDFEQRKKIKSGKEKIIYVPISISYDANYQMYYAVCPYEGFDSYTIKYDVNTERKSGVNGFGSVWNWYHRSGDHYKLKWDCSNYSWFRFPILNKYARELNESLIAFAKVAVKSQEWSVSREYESASYGSVSSNDIRIFMVEGDLKEVFIGNNKNSNLYYKKSF